MGDQFNGSYYIQALQLLLKHNGFYPYGVDGDFGNLTRQAVVALQARAGLSQTGTVDPATWRALVSGVWLSPSASKTYSYAGQAVQLLMAQWGYAPVVDGWYGTQSAAMICDFQRAYGLTVDGIAGPETAFFLLR
jgi:peptidoglycan hydrolase-like protein with peptidoglycan-binding domain